MSILNANIKPIDLDNNSGLSFIDNHAAQQHHDVYKKFYHLLDIVKPKRILEIGTALGGFTVFLYLSCKELGLNTDILSYDINSQSWYPDIISMGVNIKTKNIFQNNYKSIDQDVIDFIKSDNITMILCDGGNKIQEFNLLSTHMKPNDIIMAHDYVSTSEYFENQIKNKIWNWHEISYKDIENSIIDNNLTPFMSNEMADVVWCCFQKTGYNIP